VQWRRNEFEGGGGEHPSKAKVGEHRSGAKRLKNFFGRVLPYFGSKGTIDRFGERFRDGHSTV